MISARAHAAHAAYLGRVATYLDDASIDDPLHALAPLDPRQVAALVDRLGADPLALLADGAGTGWPLMAAQVERVGRLFRVATEPGEGVPAVVVVARDHVGAGAEFVAWSPREGWAASETGTLALLGREWINPLDDGAVDVHAGVLEWLRAGRRGCVVLDQRRAVPVLRDCDKLIVGDDAHGRALLKAMRVRLPQVLVREAA